MDVAAEAATAHVTIASAVAEIRTAILAACLCRFIAVIILSLLSHRRLSCPLCHRFSACSLRPLGASCRRQLFPLVSASPEHFRQSHFGYGNAAAGPMKPAVSPNRADAAGPAGSIRKGWQALATVA